MRKKVFGRKLGRGKDSRKALLRSLIRALVLNGKIETTRSRAKAIVGEVDKLITTARPNTVFAKRKVLAKLGNDQQTANKLFSLLPFFDKRVSGFTRIVNLPRRAGDLAEMVKMEFVDKFVEKKATKQKKTSDKPQV